MNDFQFDTLVAYLAEKGCKFIVKTDYLNNMKRSIMCLHLSKVGKFYRADNKIISKGYAALLVRAM